MKTQQISIRLPEFLLEAIAHETTKTGLPRSEVIVKSLLSHFGLATDDNTPASPLSSRIEAIEGDLVEIKDRLTAIESRKTSRNESRVKPVVTRNQSQDESQPYPVVKADDLGDRPLTKAELCQAFGISSSNASAIAKRKGFPDAESFLNHVTGYTRAPGKNGLWHPPSSEPTTPIDE